MNNNFIMFVEKFNWDFTLWSWAKKGKCVTFFNILFFTWRLTVNREKKVAVFFFGCRCCWWHHRHRDLAPKPAKCCTCFWHLHSSCLYVCIHFNLCTCFCVHADPWLCLSVSTILNVNFFPLKVNDWYSSPIELEWSYLPSSCGDSCVLFSSLGPFLHHLFLWMIGACYDTNLRLGVFVPCLACLLAYV